MEPTSLTSIPSSAAGRPAPKLEDVPPVARDRQLGWALVGLGKLTLGELLPAFAETRFCKLTALVSGNPGKARQVATQQGLELDAIYDYSGFDRIALDQRVDVVYIVLPNALHAAYTIRALRAGKHVLCEKPMATTVEQCEAMIGAAEEACYTQADSVSTPCRQSHAIRAGTCPSGAFTASRQNRGAILNKGLTVRTACGMGRGMFRAC